VLLLVSSQWHGRVLLLLLELQQKFSMQVSVFTGLYLLYGADEVSGKVVIEKSLSYMLLLMVPEQKDFSFHTFQDLHFLWFQHI
jgi:hypothetical protein